MELTLHQNAEKLLALLEEAKTAEEGTIALDFQETARNLAVQALAIPLPSQEFQVVPHSSILG